jgi:hypothetical protein
MAKPNASAVTGTAAAKYQPNVFFRDEISGCMLKNPLMNVNGMKTV